MFDILFWEKLIMLTPFKVNKAYCYMHVLEKCNTYITTRCNNYSY